MDMYSTIICLKLKATKFRQLKVINGGSFEFLFLRCLFFFVGCELAGIFMNVDVQFGVGEFCVVWNGWLDLYLLDVN
jgi:hypothetical protein